MQTLLELARGELGTRESPAGSNRVKYNTAYYGREVSGAAYPWCCVFIWWLFQQAGLSALFYGGGKTASCGALASYAKTHGLYREDGGQVGDLVFLRFSGTAIEHIGLVERVCPDGSLITIEGNTGSGNDANGGQVQSRTRRAGNVVGFYRPDYEEGRQQHRQDIGQHMHRQDPCRRGAHQAGAFDIVHIPQRGERRAGNSGEAGDKHQAQGQNDIVFSAPQDTDDHQGQQDTGECGQGIVEAHQDLIRRAAEIARQGTHRRAAHHADGHCAQGNKGGGSRPPEHPAENIPAEFVGAHQMLPGRALELGALHHGVRVIGRPERPDHDQHQQDPAEDQARPEVGVAFPSLFHRLSPPRRSRGSIR